MVFGTRICPDCMKGSDLEPDASNGRYPENERQHG
jgi:hypothetical protein